MSSGEATRLAAVYALDGATGGVGHHERLKEIGYAVDALTDHVLDVHATAEKAERQLSARWDHFAGQALAGMLADGHNLGVDHNDLASRAEVTRRAGQYADLMIALRKYQEGE